MVTLNDKHYEFIDDVIYPIIKFENGCDFHRIEQPFRALGLSPTLQSGLQQVHEGFLKLKSDRIKAGEFEQFSIMHSYFDLLTRPNVPPELFNEVTRYLHTIKAIVFNRDCGMNHDAVIELRKKYGFKVIYDLDDYWILNQEHILSAMWKKGAVAAHIENFVKLADAVTVTTERLRQRVLPLNSNCYVIPNAMHLNRTVEEIDWSAPRFGYVAGSTHANDIKSIEPIFTKDLPIAFALCGYDNDQIDGWKAKLQAMHIAELDRVRNLNHFSKFNDLQIPGMPKFANALDMNAYQEPRLSNGVTLALLNMQPGPWDYMNAVCSRVGKGYRKVKTKSIYSYLEHYKEMEVAIAPLASNEFNKYKSSLKGYEAASMGNAFIASRIAPYSDDLEGIATLCSTPAEWKEAIQKHMNPVYAKSQAQKLQDWFLENRSYEAVNKIRLAAYAEILNLPTK